jgi:hypothetical protein
MLSVKVRFRSHHPHRGALPNDETRARTACHFPLRVGAAQHDRFVRPWPDAALLGSGTPGWGPGAAFVAAFTPFRRTVAGPYTNSNAYVAWGRQYARTSSMGSVLTYSSRVGATQTHPHAQGQARRSSWATRVAQLFFEFLNSRNLPPSIVVRVLGHGQPLTS